MANEMIEVKASNALLTMADYYSSVLSVMKAERVDMERINSTLTREVKRLTDENAALRVEIQRATPEPCSAV